MGIHAVRTLWQTPSPLHRMPRSAVWVAASAVVLAAPVVAAWWNTQLGSARPPAWDALLAMLLVAPVAEEIVFRVGLQDWLERRAWSGAGAAPTGVAIVVSSVAFALCHALGQGTWLALASFFPSLALGALYKTCGLRVAIACHAWFNLCLWAATLAH